MNLKSKFFITVATVAASGLSLATSALAGPGVGGVAGSASFQLSPTGQVRNAAVAAGVGKDTAYAGANVRPGFLGPNLDAFAVGTGGSVTTSTFSNYVQSVGPDTSRGTPQTNFMGGFTNINATTGTTSVLP